MRKVELTKLRFHLTSALAIVNRELSNGSPENFNGEYISQGEIDENKREIKYLVIHCSATMPSMEVTKERITKWHLKRGFADIGYHFLVHRDGTVEKGRDLDGDGYVMEEQGAHVKGFNPYSIGICWIGGLDENSRNADNRTPEQSAALADLIKELSTVYPQAKIRGHRDFPNVKKSCPNFEVVDWCESIGIQPN